MRAATRHDQVSAIETAGVDFDEDLPRPWLGRRHVLDLDALVGQYGGFHRRLLNM